MPPLFRPVNTIQATLDQTSVVDGKVYFTQDSERLFFDYDGVRTEVRDIIILSTETERAELLAPKNKFYFVLGTKVLWVYQNGVWYEVSSGSSGSSGGGGIVAILTETFDAGTAIASVTLSQAIAGDSSIIAVNVDNTTLLRAAYSLDADNATINFTDPITAEIGIDVVYAHSTTGLAASTMSLASTPNYSVTELYAPAGVLSSNSTYYLQLTEDTALNFDAWNFGSEDKIILYLDVVQNAALTLPASIKWKDGIPPSLELDGHYILEFRSINGGNTIYGTIDKYI